LGAHDAAMRIDAELARDRTDQGERFAFALRGAIPDESVKRAQWERIREPALPRTHARAGAGSFHNPFRPDLSALFEDDWFAVARKTDWEAEQHWIGIWFDNLIPPLYTPEFLERSKRELEAIKLPPRARRAWRESNDQIERVIAIRAADETPASPH